MSREKLSRFSSNLELEVPHPEGIQTENFVCFCLGNVEQQMRENGVFFTPVKYTLVCRAPQVSWTARHTTVCLDDVSLIEWGSNSNLSYHALHVIMQVCINP